MPASVIMPALELAQETGKVIRWLKAPGDPVRKGEPLLEIETDKVTVEIEAPASGVLEHVTAQEGDVVPVGRTIALIVDAGPAAAGAASAPPPPSGSTAAAPSGATAAALSGGAAVMPSSEGAGALPSSPAAVKASPLARKLAEQHGVDLAQVETASGRIEKTDVLAHVERAKRPGPINGTAARLPAASPKARRLAAERGVDLGALRGSGPGGAVLAADLVTVEGAIPRAGVAPGPVHASPAGQHAPATGREERGVGVSTVWRIMAERMTASWTSAPHFYLVREVNVSRLVSWRDRASQRTGVRLTYTDLLLKLVAATLAQHPAVNASWKDGAIVRNADINVGLAVAIDDGLVVPVLHRADTLGLADIAGRREDLVTRAQAGRLRPADIQGGSFTISNLGMFGVDAFNAILNPPQAAILAVGRVADRVVPVNGQPAVQPTTVLTLSCDHRALDGARAARFLGALADLVEEPLALLV